MKSKEEMKIYRHNYYIKHKDIEQAQMKVWQANNPEKVRQIKEQLKEDGYYKNYYDANKEEIIAYNINYRKNFYKQFERHVVYLLVNKSMKVLYTGSSFNIRRRLENHIGGWSHLELTKEKWNALECNYFQYCYLDVGDNNERLYIESLLINKFEPVLNSYEPIKNNNITEARKAELKEYADTLIFKVWDK
ncbi:GIY-YIG nuclease family protein [Clostridium tagluense]|uniref:GIY-YIG domain-containing protein n=1 Tax=Clostridium tagluense TaxID=360422 RepID=A0A401ULP1_9CLOT|nr:GIY-YIG nuclease family protein [Clostridium tagluense]GCD10450.1 hypothetical protein Ctaglu_20730 [Clostridium tagluense]